MTSLEEKILAINNTTLGATMSNRYTNSVSISGWILQQPKFKVNKELNRKSCSFILHQIGLTSTGETNDDTFPVICYVSDTIFRLIQETTSVCYICIIGSLMWQPTIKTYAIYMNDFQIVNWLDMELEPRYHKKRKDSDTLDKQETDKL